MNDRTEIEARFLKAAAALLHAGKKAAAAFEECGFISVRSFKTKQPRGHKNIKPLLSKAARLCCTRTTKPYGFRQRRLYFTAVIQHKKSRDPCQAPLYACNKAGL